MTNLNLSFTLLTYGVVIFSAALKLSTARTVWLYGDSRLEKLLYKTNFNTSSDCNSFPDSVKEKAVYVLTDTCIMVYKSKDCNNGANHNVKVLENFDGSRKSTELTKGFTAFQPCSSSSKYSDSNKLEYNATRQQNVALLNVAISQATLERGPEISDEFILKVVPLTTIRNDGNVTMTYDYKASKVFTEFLAIDRSNWYADVTTVTTQLNMRFDQPEFDSFVDATFPSHLRRAFNKGDKTVDSSPIYLFEQPHDFNVHQLVQIPACTQYSIETSFQVNFMMIFFQLSMVVSGYDDEENRIPATVLKDILPEGLSYRATYNEYEVIAESYHSVTTEYGNFLRSNSNSSIIGGCG